MQRLAEKFVSDNSVVGIVDNTIKATSQITFGGYLHGI